MSLLKHSGALPFDLLTCPTCPPILPGGGRVNPEPVLVPVDYDTAHKLLFAVGGYGTSVTLTGSYAYDYNEPAIVYPSGAVSNCREYNSFSQPLNMSVQQSQVFPKNQFGQRSEVGPCFSLVRNQKGMLPAGAGVPTLLEANSQTVQGIYAWHYSGDDPGQTCPPGGGSASGTVETAATLNFAGLNWMNVCKRGRQFYAVILAVGNVRCGLWPSGEVGFIFYSGDTYEPWKKYALFLNDETPVLTGSAGSLCGIPLTYGIQTPPMPIRNEYQSVTEYSFEASLSISFDATN